MFKKEEEVGGRHRKVSNPVFMVFRMFLSLIILCVLFLGAYQAFRTFSGLDPLKISPQAVVHNLLDSKYLFNLASQILSFDPKQTSDFSKIAGQLTGSKSPNVSPKPTGNLSFKFAIMTDSHNDNEHLATALKQAKSEGAAFIIHTGDFSDVGTIDELQAAKAKMDASGVQYYSTAGDHDLWDSRNKKQPALTNYTQVFGDPYRSFGFQGVRFLILYNSDNYQGMDDLQRSWAMDELQRATDAKAIFVFSATPFYHPSSDHVMGRVEPKLKAQASEMLADFKKYHVSHVFAGDTHFYSQYSDPSGLAMTTVGAITSERNAQSSRFAIVDVYDSGQYTIQDVEVK